MLHAAGMGLPYVAKRNNKGETSMALTREIKQQVVILENTMIKDYRFMS